MLKLIRNAFVMLLLMTAITCVAYPLVSTGLVVMAGENEFDPFKD